MKTTTNKTLPVDVTCAFCHEIIGYQADDYSDWIAIDPELTIELTGYDKTSIGICCEDCTNKE